MKGRRRVRRAAAIAGLTWVSAAALCVSPAAAHADVAVADLGTDSGFSVPEVDVSGIDVERTSGVAACKLGQIGLTTSLSRSSGATAVVESASASVSSTCASISLTVAIIDQDPLAAGTERIVSVTRTALVKKLGAGTGQTVSWASASPNGLRPVSTVHFKASAKSGNDTQCLEVQSTVVAGSIVTNDVVAC